MGFLGQALTPHRCPPHLHRTLLFGFSILHTSLFLARATEMALVRLYGACLDVFPPAVAILVDKGFDTASTWYPHKNLHIFPAFLNKPGSRKKGKKKSRRHYNCDEINASRPTCKLRYTAEVYFSHATQGVTILKDRIPRGAFDILEHSWDYAHGHANLKAPLRKPRCVPPGFWKRKKSIKFPGGIFFKNEG